MTDPVPAVPPAAISAITLFVENVAASRRFYQEVFAIEVFFEDADSVVFRFGGTLVNLLSAAAAPELVAPAPVGTAAAGVRAVLTVTVEDVDATAAELARRGVTLLNGPVDRPWGVRTAAFADPSGHVWEIAR